MIIHSYYYGPIGKNGLNFQASQGLTQLVGDDLVRELYNKEGSNRKRVQFSEVYQTRNGPVLAVTRIEPTQASDRRSTQVNRTVFVSLKDMADEMIKLLDKPVSFPVKPVHASLKV